MSSRSTKPLIIGEMPGPGKLHQDDRDLGPIAGSTGRRLARLLGVSLEEYCRRWDRMNVFPARIDGPWMREAAARSACIIYDQENGFVRRPLVVLLGRKVHVAFGFQDSNLFEARSTRDGRMSYVLLPHPSGLCRWWNDPANVHAAETTLRAAYAFTQEKRHVRSAHA